MTCMFTASCSVEKGVALRATVLSNPVCRTKVRFDKTNRQRGKLTGLLCLVTYKIYTTMNYH